MSFEEINSYSKWNKALWKFFFNGEDNSNPVICLDDNLFNIVGANNGIDRINQNDSYSHDFLRKTFLGSNAINNFINGWRYRTGRIVRWNINSRYNRNINSWTFKDLVIFLEGEKLDDAPAYFAMLCGIMYVACTVGANHGKIKDLARNYLGVYYSGHVGELADELFQQLHCDKKSFDPNRMICGTQRNISRIKYHAVLKVDERNDLIDFLEINNLEWDYEPYSEFINNRLVPSLNKSNKPRHIIDVVTSKEFIPYVKGILQGNLQYGKKVSNSNNSRQNEDIIWRYELYFDFDGRATFYISAISDLPFGLSVGESGFVESSKNISADFIAADTDFVCYKEQILEEYKISNIGGGMWDDVFFEKVADNIYYQVPTLQTDREYIRFVRSNKNIIHDNVWSKVSDFQISNYNIYETVKYVCKNNRTQKDKSKIDDPYSLNGVGSWFSINLPEEGQSIYWKGYTLGSRFERIKCQKGEDGKFYFQLPMTSNSQISGCLVVSKNDPNSEFNNSDMCEPEIIVDLSWKGESSKYYIDGWGGVSSNNELSEDGTTTRKQIIWTKKDATSKTDILIQILYDLADENGCVNEKKMVAAINFAMGAFNIVPTKQNRRSVIYALRRLGYMTSFYNPITRSYENQLTPSFLEQTNYSFDTINNVYLVKGVYDCRKLSDLKSSSSLIQYKRPYLNAVANNEGNSLAPEYQILPDLILIQTRCHDNWRVVNHPIALSLINLMCDISSFESTFINTDGDLYHSGDNVNSPCIIKNRNGSEILCLSHNNRYYTHEYYRDVDGYNIPIPKHLSRAYCQYKHKWPVCIIWDDNNSRVDYSKVTFVSGLSTPLLLDMTLCDLNLGLPIYENFFVVDSKKVLPFECCIIEGRSYDTHATENEHSDLKVVLQKLSGRKIDNFSNSSAIINAQYNRHINYSMYIWIHNAHKRHIVLKFKYRGYEEIIAFSIYNRVYARNNSLVNNLFFEVLNGRSINEKFSSIIKQEPLEFGDTMVPVPQRPDELHIKPVKIIIKK